MDLRRWLLLNDLPHSRELTDRIHHVPHSQCRTENILRLFAAGYRTGFLLTDQDGHPTEALRLMVSLMDGVTLCLGVELPGNVRRAFGKDGPELVNLLDESWYLLGLTDRIKAALSSLNAWSHQWVWRFLPGLDSARVTYKEDGRTRRRMCYIAYCPPNWELGDDVYEGLWRWNYEHTDGTLWRRPAPCPDGYAILERLQASGATGGPGVGGSPPPEPGPAAEALLPAAVR